MSNVISTEAANLISRAARLHTADTPASNVYLHHNIVPRGTVFSPEHDHIVVAQDSAVTFIDDEPTKNWGHKCRYLMQDARSGRVLQEVHALMPPSFAFGVDFKSVHIGTPPHIVSDFPVLHLPQLPPWIFFNPSQWYAILYAGASNNRHLNDIEFLYRTLVHTYKVPKANITVLNYNGTLNYNNNDWTPHVGPVGNWPGDNTPYQVKIDGKGTRQALLDAIAAVGKKLGANDKLLIHTNNHGGRTPNNKSSTLCAYEGPVTLPSDFGAALAALPKYKGLMVMMEQCFAGGFIDAVIQKTTATCTSIATAVDAFTSSDGGPNFDPYALSWIRAMANATESGGVLVPPPVLDANNHVTAQSAFDWSKTRGGPDDNPQYKQNAMCGGTLTLAPDPGFTIHLPPLYVKLWPWEILPDPGPETVKSLLPTLVEQAGRHDVGVPAGIAEARAAVASAARSLH
ncbi:C13 family peptidase [Rhodopseudomonas sp.]|uniref:C13 family peptidase n=1 Tax=Rhodopseudomonas sp. TaxID=1078 RepID=UPI003B3A3D13